MDQINRIVYFEAILDRMLDLQQQHPVPETAYRALVPEIRELEAYYAGPLWRQDYEDDERGLLPKSLKRGVLSQDAVFNALTVHEDIMRQLERKTPPVSIRAMTAEDTDTVLGMMRVFYASPAVHTNGSEEIFRADIAACVGASPYAEGFVFESEGGTAGYGMIAKSFSTEFGKPCVWIEDIYLLPAFRRQGIASMFIQQLRAAYPDAILRLEVEAENLPALAAYRRNGMTELPYMEMILQ